MPLGNLIHKSFYIVIKWINHILEVYMLIKLPDGSELSTESGSPAYHVAELISPRLVSQICSVKINGEISELRTELHDGDTVEFLKFDDPNGKKTFWHTTSHVMAEAIKNLYPDAELAIGPAIDEGFYYDIDCEHNFDADDLATIEAEMKKIIKENRDLEYYTLERDQALAWAREKGGKYKVELIEDLPEDAVISFYRQGDFVDLCAGPHLLRTGQIKAFKLLQISGAYWRGSEKNKMLQRIYGISFPDKKELKAYLEKLEDAKRRDHNKLGRELGYFTTVDCIGQGLPLLMPKGTAVMKAFRRLVEDEEERRGYLQTMTPLMAKSDLYKISGHWDHYRNNMFIIGDPEEKEDTCLALRPMTCPFQYQIYLSKTRSYRDLPLRLSETSTLFRNESSGEMHGLIRVRQFTISEGHLFVTPEQVREEFEGCLDLGRYMIDALGFTDDVRYQFSTWDPDNREKFIGDAQAWEESQSAMEKILKDNNIDYHIGVGDAAFYGPKLDIDMKNVYGKWDTLVTIQLDFQLAERFGMLYTDKDGERRHPFIIHRTSCGCYERTLALLLEKYAGALPLWLSPEHTRLLSISAKHNEVVKDLASTLRQRGLRVSVDLRDEKIGKKIREAQLEKVPYMLVIGDKEAESKTFAVRHRKHGDLGNMDMDTLVSRLQKEIAEFNKD